MMEKALPALEKREWVMKFREIADGNNIFMLRKKHQKTSIRARSSVLASTVNTETGISGMLSIMW